MRDFWRRNILKVGEETSTGAVGLFPRDGIYAFGGTSCRILPDAA